MDLSSPVLRLSLPSEPSKQNMDGLSYHTERQAQLQNCLKAATTTRERHKLYGKWCLYLVATRVSEVSILPN